MFVKSCQDISFGHVKDPADTGHSNTSKIDALVYFAGNKLVCEFWWRRKC